MDQRIGRRPQFASRRLGAVVAALIAGATSASAGGWPAASDGRDLHVRYFETSEATYTEIVVADQRLWVRYFYDATGQCARWIEQRPCWSEADLTVAEAEISPAHVDELVRLIDGSGFMDLGPSYGGAAAGQRHYPIEIAVRRGGREKRVIYQAYPGAGPMPDTFARLRARLDELARTAVNWCRQP